MRLVGYDIIDSAVEFFKQHQGIDKLKLNSGYSNTASKKETIMRISTALPLLRFTSDEAVDLTTTFSQNRFYFKMDNHNEFDQLKIKLGHGWQTSESDEFGYVELKRRY